MKGRVEATGVLVDMNSAKAKKKKRFMDTEALPYISWSGRWT
jgi:hypothetical protein